MNVFSKQFPRYLASRDMYRKVSSLLRRCKIKDFSNFIIIIIIMMMIVLQDSCRPTAAANPSTTMRTATPVAKRSALFICKKRSTRSAFTPRSSTARRIPMVSSGRASLSRRARNRACCCKIVTRTAVCRLVVCPIWNATVSVPETAIPRN